MIMLTKIIAEWTIHKLFSWMLQMPVERFEYAQSQPILKRFGQDGCCVLVLWSFALANCVHDTKAPYDIYLTTALKKPRQALGVAKRHIGLLMTFPIELHIKNYSQLLDRLDQLHSSPIHGVILIFWERNNFGLINKLTTNVFFFKLVCQLLMLVLIPMLLASNLSNFRVSCGIHWP